MIAKRILLATLFMCMPLYAATEPTLQLDLPHDEHITDSIDDALALEDEEQIEEGFDLSAALQDRFKISGFFSASVGRTDAKAVPSSFVAADVKVPQYEGIDNRLTFGADGAAGFQINARVTDKAEVVLQLVARSRHLDLTTSSYSVNAKWAYLNYHLKDNFSLKIGRVVFPFYLVSQYIDVAYAYPWIRPPQEIYADVPIPSSDGVLAQWVIPFDSGLQLEVEPFFIAFSSDATITGGVVPVDLTNYLGVNFNLSNDWLKFTAVYTKGTTEYNSGNPISVTFLPGVSTPGYRERTAYYGAGFQIDKSNLMLIGEFAGKKIDNQNGYFPDSRAWYVTLGYHFDKFTPLVTFAEMHQQHQSRTSVITNAPLRGAAEALLFTEQRSKELGFRYDLTGNVSLKFSVTNVRPINGTRGFFSEIPSQSTLNVFNSAINLIF